MKILILEGIATSGKSSLIKKLSELIKEQRLVVYGESKTHIPIMEKTDGLHIKFFKSLLADAVKSGADLIIFDRFHYTQLLRARATVAEYSEIEDLLMEQKTLVVFLQVDEDTIANRVRLASEHREEEWGEYVKTKGASFNEIADYYIAQQRNQLKSLGQSKLTIKVFNTTRHYYQAIADEVYSLLEEL